MGRNNHLKLIAFAVAIGLTPVVVTGEYYFSILVFMGLNAMVVIGLSLLMGYAGQISLGHAAFFGIGAYATGILTTQLGFSVLNALLAGLVISSVVAVIIGIPALRLTGHYLAIATLGIGEIVFILFNELIWLTGGPSGLSHIPPFQIGGFKFTQGIHYYFLVWGILIAMMWFSLNVIHSRVGRALQAMHSSEVAASAMGVNLTAFKIQIFVLSALFASVAGSLYAHFVSFIAPNNFALMVSIMFLVMGVVGGIHNLWGALLGACLLTFLPEYLRVFREYDILVYGAILLVMLLFMPEGFLEATQRLFKKIFRRGKVPA